MQETNNLRIRGLHALISPALLIEELPIDADVALLVNKTRKDAEAIIHGTDDRLLMIVGPCSIHDQKAALEYAQELKAFADTVADDLCIIMRVYFEKPRTRVGWKGLINDPYLDGSFHINQGLRSARHLLLDINRLGLPTGSEFLDTIIPQYISDLTSWSAIGARTAESQIHRELASGLSMPLGFKNGTTGNVQIAIDACLAAKEPHHFLGVSRQGVASIVSTTGNADCHVILRGSSDGTNYDKKSIHDAVKGINAVELSPRVMVDCSHGNSRKNHTRQAEVVESLCEQIKSGSDEILGAMIESFLIEGNQKLAPGKPLKYGQSITDACLSWNQTKPLLKKLASAVKSRRKQGKS